MKKKLTALLIATMMTTIFVPVTAMAYDYDQVDAGKYGKLTAINYGDTIDSGITDNDGSGRLVHAYDVQNNDTGVTYEKKSEIRSYLGEYSLMTYTNAWKYPEPRAVFGTHEVRGDITKVIYTQTKY